MKLSFTIAVDTREQRPFEFANLRSDARDGRRPLEVSCEKRMLASGDYSVVGCEDRIAVERKSLEDLFQTLGQGRKRFEREIQRLAAMAYSAVVIEADWQTILLSPPVLSKLSPKSVFRTVLSWQQRYPTVHWWPCVNRRLAEIVTFRILERFWKSLDGELPQPRMTPQKWEEDHQRRVLLHHGLAEEFPFGCDAIDHVAEALLESRSENERLRGIVDSLASRVASQSEILTKKAERLS